MTFSFFFTSPVTLFPSLTVTICLSSGAPSIRRDWPLVVHAVQYITSLQLYQFNWKSSVCIFTIIENQNFIISKYYETQKYLVTATRWFEPTAASLPASAESGCCLVFHQRTPRAACSDPFCSHCTPRTALPDIKRTLLWSTGRTELQSPGCKTLQFIINTHTLLKTGVAGHESKGPDIGQWKTVSLVCQLSVRDRQCSPFVKEIPLIGRSRMQISAQEEKVRKKGKVLWTFCCRIHDSTHLVQFMIFFLHQCHSQLELKAVCPFPKVWPRKDTEWIQIQICNHRVHQNTQKHRKQSRR